MKSLQLTEQDIALCFELVRVQTNTPQGCAPEFIHQCEDLRMKLKRTLDRFTLLYREFARLGGNAELLKTLNPTEQAVADLVAFMQKVEVAA